MTFTPIDDGKGALCGTIADVRTAIIQSNENNRRPSYVLLEPWLRKKFDQACEAKREIDADPSFKCFAFAGACIPIAVWFPLAWAPVAVGAVLGGVRKLTHPTIQRSLESPYGPFLYLTFGHDLSEKKKVPADHYRTDGKVFSEIIPSPLYRIVKANPNNYP